MKNNYILIPCISLLVLTSCASYRSSLLNNPSQGIVNYSSVKKDNLVVIAKEFDKDDCRRYLDRDVIAKGYQPVQLYIRNNSEKDFYFSIDNVSLPCVSATEVARRVHTSTFGRVLGYGVGALFLWPLAIPAVVDGIRSSEANEALDRDFASKAAKEAMIFRGLSLNKLIFVRREDYQNNFQVTLIDQETKTPSTFNLEAVNEF